MTNHLLSLIRTPSNDRSAHQLRAVYTDLLRHLDFDNDYLGQRRGIDDEDLKCHKTYLRFSFRRNVLPSENDKAMADERVHDKVIAENNIKYSAKVHAKLEDDPNYLPTNTNSQINTVEVCNDKVDLATAFRILAATKSPDKEGDNYGAVAIRDRSSVCGIQRAKALENRVTELIKEIGEIVVNAGDHGQGGSRKNIEGPPPVRTDQVFEYFCEKCILYLFVEIANEVRQGKTTTSSKTPSLSVRGVVWSGSVKAQIYLTVSLLISNARNQSVIHYLLSNNYINKLITCILPVQQWTEQALVKMLPAYIDLLKNLALLVTDDPHLFSFLTIENQIISDNDGLEDSSTECIEFPLFSAALETAVSVYAQSDSQTYATSLAIIVNLMQIPYKPIQAWISRSITSQRILADHLCQRLLVRFYRIANLTIGPVVNCARHNSIARQLERLKDDMGMVHDMLWSGVRGMDVRLCESLLQKVVFVLLKKLLQTSPTRPFLVVGLIDADVIPELEAFAQVATVFFSYMFSKIVYVPFRRMLSVALFHQNSTPIWLRSKPVPDSTEPSGAYVLVPALNDIVSNKEFVDTRLNPFRQEMFKTLEGDYGEWRTTAAACLLQSVLNADSIETDDVIMSAVTYSDKSASSLDHSIAKFLTQSHRPSMITVRALECMGYLGLMILYRSVMNIILDDHMTKESIRKYLSRSPVWNALRNARNIFCREAMKFRYVTGVSDIYLDLTEAVIKSSYTVHRNESGSATFVCHLSRHGSVQNMIEADFLVRQSRCISSNDVETARFYIKMGIHFRALCRVADQFSLDIETEGETLLASNSGRDTEKIDFIDIADTIIRTIGGLSNMPKTGDTFDLNGRMFFRFRSAVNLAETQRLVDNKSIKRHCLDDIDTLYSATNFTLVLDPTELFVVKPMVQKMEENHGTILFGISLRNIIAAAVDEAWLHIAIRSPDTILNQTLIKNGNMALQFESPGTCLVVKQYLDRSRGVLRQDLLSRVSDLFQNEEKLKSNDP